MVKGGNSLEIVTTSGDILLATDFEISEVHPLVKIPDKLDQVGSSGGKVGSRGIGPGGGLGVLPGGGGYGGAGSRRLPHPGNHMEMGP